MGEYCHTARSQSVATWRLESIIPGELLGAGPDVAVVVSPALASGGGQRAVVVEYGSELEPTPVAELDLGGSYDGGADELADHMPILSIRVLYIDSSLPIQ